MSKRKRIIKVIIYLLIAVLSLLMIYYAAGFPYLSAKMAMHAMEKAQLVGPSEIIACAEVDYGFWDRIIIGETEYGYTLFEYSADSGYEFGTLSYHEKWESITCFTTGIAADLKFIGSPMPVYVVPENRGAASARLTLYAEYQDSDGVVHEVTNISESRLREDAFFLFEVDLTEMEYDVFQFWFSRLNEGYPLYQYFSGTATIEIFDRCGGVAETLVLEFPQIT